MTTVPKTNYGTTTMGSGTNAVDCEQLGQDVGSAYEKVTDFAGDAIEAAAPWVALQAGVTAGAVAGEKSEGCQWWAGPRLWGRGDGSAGQPS